MWFVFDVVPYPGDLFMLVSMSFSDLENMLDFLV